MFDNKLNDKLTNEQKIERGKGVLSAYKFFNFFDPKLIMSKDKTLMENLCDVLSAKITLNPGETDFVVM